MADKNHHFATKLLHHHGFLTRSDVTSRFVGWDKLDDIGRADIFAAKSGKAIHVEVKYGKSRFQFSNWRKNQRAWAQWTMSKPFSVPYYLYLTLGEHPANYNAEKYSPRKSWLLTIEKFLEAEALVTEYQKSIPYRVATGMKKELQTKQLDAVTLWQDWELKWAKNNSLNKPEWDIDHAGQSYGGFWVLPDIHPLYAMLLDT